MMMQTILPLARTFKTKTYEKPHERVYGKSPVHGLSGLGSTNMDPGGSAKVALPPGSSSGASSQLAAAAPVAHASNSGEPQLVLRNVANIWGKQPAIAPAAFAPSPQAFASRTPTPVPSAYGGFGVSATSASLPVAPVKTAEQL